MKGAIRPPRTAGGTWAYRIDLGVGPDGCRNQKQVAGFLSRQEAEAALTEALAGQGGGDRTTVAGFLERVWLPAKRAEVERSTFDQYSWAVRRHIVPWLGAARLGDLTPAMLDGWLASLVGGDPATGRSTLSPTSARLVRKVLSMACGDAVERGFLADNPVVRTEARAASGSLARYGQVRLSTVVRLHAAGFALLATGDHPHFDIILPDLASGTMDRLDAAFDPAEPNPGRG